MTIPIVGDIVKSIIDTGGGIIRKLVKDKDLAEQLTHELSMTVEGNRAEYEKMYLESETRIFEARQKTIQTELNQSDVYTKQTRPKIARMSFYAGLGYVFLSQIPHAGIQIFDWVLMPWQFNWEVLLVLYSPALTYMGVRGWEKWKAGGSKV